MANAKPSDVNRMRLQSAKLSVTQPRLAVLGLFTGDHVCLSVDDLLSEAKKKKVVLGDWSTVFRTLKTFEESGLVTAYSSSDGITRYELRSETEDHAHHHHHFICRECKTIEAFENCPTELFEKAAKKLGFKIENHVVEVQGLCRDCR